MSASVTPGRARRFWWTGITTSRWMRRSCSKARASIDALTVPSMAFSMATKPRSTSPASVTASTSEIDGSGTSSARARSGSLSSASSVKVPKGPRKAMRGMAQHNTAVDEAALRQLLDRVRTGEVAPDDAVAALRRLPWADLGFARVDHHRALRQGMAEAVYAPGKTPLQCAAIVGELLAEPGGAVLLTRAEPEQIAAALDVAPGGIVTGRTVVWRTAAAREERVVVVTAGTADGPVADECEATLAAHGFGVIRVTDVGV